MLTRLWKALGWTSSGTATRLTEAEALERAHAALARTPEAADVALVVQTAARAENGGRWAVRTSTVGLWWVVEIDDATGEVVAIRKHGLR